MRHLTCDIAVIGSGLAGLRAALASCGPSLSVVLCSKSRPGIGSCTAISQGHFRSALFRRESRGAHFRSDFPAASRDWTGHVLISKTGLEFRKRAIQCSDRTEFLS